MLTKSLKEEKHQVLGPDAVHSLGQTLYGKRGLFFGTTDHVGPDDAPDQRCTLSVTRLKGKTD